MGHALTEMEMLPFWQNVLSLAALEVVIEATYDKYWENITWIHKNQQCDNNETKHNKMYAYLWDIL